MKKTSKVDTSCDAAFDALSKKVVELELALSYTKVHVPPEPPMQAGANRSGNALPEPDTSDLHLIQRS